MSTECNHLIVSYEQSSTAVRAVLFVLHKFVCSECRTAARLVDRIDGE